MGGLVWNRTFHAMYATPITSRDVALGNLAWIGARLVLIASVFTVVIVAFGAARSPLVVLGIPVSVLTGLAFAAPIAAFAATQRTPDRFAAIFRFIVTPLFIFSGTFFPIEGLPEVIRPLAWLTPLYHGVARHARRAADARARPRPPGGPAGVHRCGHVLPRPDGAREAGAGMTALPLSSTFLIGSRRSLRLVERNLYVYRHGWLVILSGFFEPLFYLLGIGFGIGTLVGSVVGPAGQEISYQLFVAPALLASASMNGAINESTFNFFFKLNYDKTFSAILATPLSSGDIAVGELTWALIRGGLYAIGFLVVMVVLGLVVSPWVVLALPAALLVGFAFGAVGMAATSFMKTWQDFDLIQLVVLPLFLFSATFYPIETYPEAIRVIVQLTPLYQGVDLIRSLAVGAISPVLLVHVAYLLVLGFAGLFVVSRRLDRLLLQ
jgi:lipooligosaccharide transport system permease protein